MEVAVVERIERILVGTDLSAKAPATLTYAADLALGLKAALIVLHVLDGCQVAAIEQAYGRIFAAGNSDDLETYLQALRQEAHSNLRALVSAACPARMRPRLIVRQGEPHLQIIAEAKKQNADLVVIGEGRHGYIVNHLVGTTAGHLLRQLNIPMISLRGGEKYKRIHPVRRRKRTRKATAR